VVSRAGGASFDTDLRTIIDHFSGLMRSLCNVSNSSYYSLLTSLFQDTDGVVCRFGYVNAFGVSEPSSAKPCMVSMLMIVCTFPRYFKIIIRMYYSKRVLLLRCAS